MSKVFVLMINFQGAVTLFSTHKSKEKAEIKRQEKITAYPWMSDYISIVDQVLED